MALEVSTPLGIVALLSWMLSAYLLVKLWRGADHLALKIGLPVLLVAPVVGPLFYFWVQSFPDSNHPELMDHYRNSTDVLDRWRSRLERSGKLPPLVQHWRRKRRK